MRIAILAFFAVCLLAGQALAHPQCDNVNDNGHGEKADQYFCN